MRKLLPRLGPILRITIAIVSFMVSLVLVFDVFLEILPTREHQQIQTRTQVANVLAGQLTAGHATGDYSDARPVFEQMLSSVPELYSIGVRKRGEGLVNASAAHAGALAQAKAGEGGLRLVVVPLLTKQGNWGDIEFIFKSGSSGALLDYLRDPSVLIILLFLTIGPIGVYLYLRKALEHLDPSQAVPQRVRKAFDTLTDAVLILDTKGRIMLANDAFKKLDTGNRRRVENTHIGRVGWMVRANQVEGAEVEMPWDVVMRTSETILGKNLHVQLFDGRQRELTMNCSAISDGTDMARGCLITLDDVTSLTEANLMLMHSVAELEISAEKIRVQNDELQKHAHYDHLTGCINRRAFFDRGEPLFAKMLGNGGNLSCIMGDIDFFKSFNDRYGHAVGDLVIQQTAAAMGRALRSNDLLCRYGGEEFCILLVDADEDTAIEIAERIRAIIENEAGPGVRHETPLRVTASLGLATLGREVKVESLTQFIDLADQALYVAKKSGRNRVAGFAGTILSAGVPPVTPVQAAAAAVAAH